MISENSVLVHLSIFLYTSEIGDTLDTFPTPDSISLLPKYLLSKSHLSFSTTMTLIQTYYLLSKILNSFLNCSKIHLATFTLILFLARGKEVPLTSSL